MRKSVPTTEVDLRLCALGPALREKVQAMPEWQEGTATVAECAMFCLDVDIVTRESEWQAYATEVRHAADRLRQLEKLGHEDPLHPVWLAELDCMYEDS